MAHTLMFHFINDDPIVGEVEEFPSTTDSLIIINNPRRRDGKDIHFLESNVVSVILPVHRISFIELMPSDSEEAIVSFVKD
jgi:hypothetical protein